MENNRIPLEVINGEEDNMKSGSLPVGTTNKPLTPKKKKKKKTK